MLTDRLIINNSKELHAVNPDKILYVSSDGNYSNIHLTDGGTIQAVPFSIGQVAEKIRSQLSGWCDSKFVRLGRQYIVNVRHIQSIYPTKKLLVFDSPHSREQGPVRISPSASALSALMASLSAGIAQTLLSEVLQSCNDVDVDDDTCLFLNVN